MKIQVVKDFSKDRVPVFLVKEKEKPSDHFFFKFLLSSDKQYLAAFEKKITLKAGDAHHLFAPSGSRLLILVLPEKSKFTHRKAMLTARRVIVETRKQRIKSIVVNFDDFWGKGFFGGPENLAGILAMHCEMANFEFTGYKTPPPEGWFFVDEVWISSKRNSKKFAESLKRGQIIGEEVNAMRVLSNTPGGDMTPAKLAEAALKAGRTYGIKVKVLNESEIKKLGMGGVLGVSKGSSERPRFIVMEYMKGNKNEKPVVLVGKGVTFDTGGLNLKPEQGIYEMHMDMSGGAAVIHTVAALARLKVKKNIVGLVPAVENMPSGSSYHPGDLLKTMSGKTIEVLNTDAEGRVILADALTYAQKYNPRLVIDVATLTGAAMSALGQRASAIFTTDPKLEKTLREVGEKTGDFVWPLPLWEEYEEEVKGTFGDVANIGKTRYGGAITGAVFLWQFVKGFPWVHIDIAPRMTAIEGEFLAKGSAGPAVGLLTSFLETF